MKATLDDGRRVDVTDNSGGSGGRGDPRAALGVLLVIGMSVSLFFCEFAVRFLLLRWWGILVMIIVLLAFLGLIVLYCLLIVKKIKKGRKYHQIPVRLWIILIGLMVIPVLAIISAYYFPDTVWGTFEGVVVSTRKFMIFLGVALGTLVVFVFFSYLIPRILQKIIRKKEAKKQVKK